MDETIKFKVVVFDLDDTLIRGDACNKVCPESKVVIESLLASGFKLGIASHNSDAAWYLRRNSLDHFFEHVESFHTRLMSKLEHVNRLAIAMNVKKEECVMFDDEPEIVQELTRNGVRGVLVNHLSGVTLADIGFLVTG